MSTYRKRTQPKPTTAAGLRAQASASGNSIFRNRPRSIAGLFGSSQNSYSTLLGNSTSYSTPNYLNKTSTGSGSTGSSNSSSSNGGGGGSGGGGNSAANSYKNSYSSNSGNSLSSYQNPYTTYGGTASGYGALTLPSSHSSIGSLNLASPSTSYGYFNGGFNNRSSASIHRVGSFNKPKPKLDNSSFGSRSSSLQSLAGSEGYVSGHERSGRSSRLGSVSSLSSETGAPISSRTKASVTGAAPTSENGELDYKKLYEESQAENERLREKLRKADEQLKETQSLLDKAQSAAQKSALSETEKRERRAMERKLSEMEEELKQLQKLKAENERLKAENRALTRVVSKLTNTAK